MGDWYTSSWLNTLSPLTLPRMGKAWVKGACKRVFLSSCNMSDLFYYTTRDNMILVVERGSQPSSISLMVWIS